MPLEMDCGPNRRMLAARNRESSLPSLKSSLPSRTGGAISYVPETNHPLQPLQYDLQVRKPTT